VLLTGKGISTEQMESKSSYGVEVNVDKDVECRDGNANFMADSLASLGGRAMSLGHKNSQGHEI